MKPLFDLIEDEGLEYVKQFPKNWIIKQFEKTDTEDLGMYVVIGLTAEELEDLVGSEVLKRTMRRLNHHNLFAFLSYLDRGEDVLRCFEHETFSIKFEYVYSSMFYTECIQQSRMMFSLIDHGWLTYDMIMKKFKILTVHHMMKLCRHPSWNAFFQPFFKMMRHCIFPLRGGSAFRMKPRVTIQQSAQRCYSRDLAGYIMEFINPTKNEKNIIR